MHTRTRTDSYPSIRPHLHGHHASTRRFIPLSPRLRELSPLTSPLASSPPGPSTQYSCSRHQQNEYLNFPGDVTPHDRNSLRDLTVSTKRLDESPLLPIYDDAEQENPYPSSSCKVPILPLSFSDLPSLSSEDLLIYDLDTSDNGEDVELKESLSLSFPHHAPATFVSPTSHTRAHKQTRRLKTLGIGIEEDLRNDEIERSFWPRLLGRSSTAKSPIAELTSTTLGEAILQVGGERIASMENWDGKSLHVAPLSTLSLASLSLEKGKIATSSRCAYS